MLNAEEKEPDKKIPDHLKFGKQVLLKSRKNVVKVKPSGQSESHEKDTGYRKNRRVFFHRAAAIFVIICAMIAGNMGVYAAVDYMEQRIKIFHGRKKFYRRISRRVPHFMYLDINDET